MRSKTPEGEELIVELLISLFKQVKKYQTYSILFILMISWGGFAQKDEDVAQGSGRCDERYIFRSFYSLSFR